MTLNLTKADESELENINALVIQSEIVNADDQSNMDAFIEQYAIKNAALSTGKSYVLYKDNFLIGFFMIKSRSDTHELEYFYIEHSHLGKGYGKTLWSCVEDICAKNGIRKLIIVCGKKVTGFYLKMGAEKIGEIDSKVYRGVKIDFLQYQVKYKIVEKAGRVPQCNYELG